MEIISSFRGKYDFLSNFSSVLIRYNGHMYNSLESAFQAQKNPDCADMFRNMGTQEALKAKRRPIIDPGEAKRLGRKIPLRPDWNTVKDQIMLELLTAKFTQNESLKRELIETGDAVLIEGNTWHDNYWGYCICPKCVLVEQHNKLGNLLMQIRDVLKADKNPLEVIRLD